MPLYQWLATNKVVEIRHGAGVVTIPAMTMNEDLHNLKDYEITKVERTTCWLKRK